MTRPICDDRGGPEGKPRRLTFDRTAGDVDRCKNCNALEAFHQWECDGCHAVLPTDLSGLPLLHRACKRGATLYCGVMLQ